MMAGEALLEILSALAPALKAGYQGYTGAQDYNRELGLQRQKGEFQNLLDMGQMDVRRGELSHHEEELDWDKRKAISTAFLAMQTGAGRQMQEETASQKEYEHEMEMELLKHKHAMDLESMRTKNREKESGGKESKFTPKETAGMIETARKGRVDPLMALLEGYPPDMTAQPKIDYLNSPAWASAYRDTLGMTWPGMIPGADTTRAVPAQPQGVAPSYVAPRSSLPNGMSKMSMGATQYELNPADYEIATSIQSYLQANPNVDIDWDAIKRDNPDADVAYIRKALGR